MSKKATQTIETPANSYEVISWDISSRLEAIAALISANNRLQEDIEQLQLSLMHNEIAIISKRREIDQLAAKLRHFAK